MTQKPKTNEVSLKTIRNRINRIDQQLLQLMNERASMAQHIGQLKTQGLKYRPEREASVLRELQRQNQGPLSRKNVTFLFREIMSACLALEERLKISYLGPRGTYSEAAAHLYFGHAVHLVPKPTIADAIREVEIDRCHFAMVPVENSIEGAVGSTLDLLLTSHLQVCGEAMQPIHHHLLTHAKTLTAIKKVTAHPQALGQCRRWLRSYLPHAETVPAASNAEAAHIASQHLRLAAIAGDSAAAYYGLAKLADNIEDESNNTTRFLVLGHLVVPASGVDKTSLIVSAKNIPGAVHRLLSPFAKESVSLTRLESRPAPLTQVGAKRLGEYIFFIDIEGHVDDAKVTRALKKS